jgi:hypothetical protein
MRISLGLIAVAALTACGGSDEVSQESIETSRAAALPVFFGKSGYEVAGQMLADGDVANDNIASMLIAAGGPGAFSDMQPEDRTRLAGRHGVDFLGEGGPAAEAEEDRKTRSSLLFGTTDPPCVQYLDPSWRNKAHSRNRNQYVVDASGRPSLAVGAYRQGSWTPGNRTSCSNTVGTWGAAPAASPPPIGGYVGGHLIAASLGGSPARFNLTPQANQINNSTFQKLESAVRHCAAKSLYYTDYWVTPVYPSSTALTPSQYTVWVRVIPSFWAWFSPPPGIGEGGEGSIVIPNYTASSPPIATLAFINAQVDGFTAGVRGVCPL